MNVRSAAIPAGVAGALAGAYALAYRPWFLRWGSTQAEREAAWPGDELVEQPRVTSMRAITIAASPAEVWPWIQQIGQDRGGFYSYRILENFAGAQMPKIEALHPELYPQRAAGETVWLSAPQTYGGKGRMVVAVLQPQRAMILVSPDDYERVRAGEKIRGGTWGFILDPLPEGGTRLIMRSVASSLGPLWELPHFIMEQRMMTHLKQLVERERAAAS